MQPLVAPRKEHKSNPMLSGPRRAEAVQSRYERFKLLYLGNDPKLAGNGTQCAIECGYSPKTASVQASQLLKRLRVQQGVEGRSHELLSESLLTEANLTKVLEQILFVDQRTIYDKDGNLLPIAQWPENAAMALSSMDRDEITAGQGTGGKPVGNSYKPRFYDKLVALEKAMRFKGMFERDNKQRSEAIALEVSFTTTPTRQEEAGDRAKIIDAVPTAATETTKRGIGRNGRG